MQQKILLDNLVLDFIQVLLFQIMLKFILNNNQIKVELNGHQMDQGIMKLLTLIILDLKEVQK
jgi:hypothetical protein